jgi:hypothetical protein
LNHLLSDWQLLGGFTSPFTLLIQGDRRRDFRIQYLTRCVEMTRMDAPWILRRLTNASPFFNSLSNRLRITNYCLRSVSSSLLKFTRFIQGNNIAWTNLDMIRNLQQLHMNKKFYTYKTLPFNSHWIFFWIKSVMWSE